MSADALQWWSDEEPAILRRRAGSGFSYRGPNGTLIRDPETIRRIRSLAIPPAWTDVRICPDPLGYLQATGRDAKGRKQYRYHPDWRRDRDEAKFRRLLEFGQALPAIRARVERDLALPGLPREKVLALVVRLLELTHARVGNETYARENQSFGLTTLRNRHAAVEGSAVRLRFRGKSGKVHQIGLRDRRVARLVRRCQELPGRELFEYLDADGTVRVVRSDDVNAWLRETAGADVSAKMFRTWAATVIAYRALRGVEAPEGARARRRALAEAMTEVSDHLGNTPAVARASYVHPAVVDAFEAGQLQMLAVETEALADTTDPALPWLPEDEEAVLELLRTQLERPKGRRRRTADSGLQRGAQPRLLSSGAAPT